MSLPNVTKRRQIFTKIITGFIPIKIYRKWVRGVLYMGISNFIRARRNERTAMFPNELSVVAIMKNEGAYLKEWLDYHILVGVEKFYLYDNESTDNTMEILQPYIERGIVDYTFFPGKARQNPAYIDVINRYANDTRWLAVIDLDEFIVPVEHNTIPEFLYTLPQNFACLVMSWVMYGSSGHIEKPAGLVIENFKRHAPTGVYASGVKSIINPRFIVRQYSAHVNEFAGFLIDENGHKLGCINQTNNPPASNKIRCNHYITKSFEEYRARCAKGDAGAKDGVSEWKRWTREKFDGYDHNEVYDTVMDRFIEKLKAQNK